MLGYLKNMKVLLLVFLLSSILAYAITASSAKQKKKTNLSMSKMGNWLASEQSQMDDMMSQDMAHYFGSQNVPNTVGQQAQYPPAGAKKKAFKRSPSTTTITPSQSQQNSFEPVSGKVPKMPKQSSPNDTVAPAQTSSASNNNMESGFNFSQVDPRITELCFVKVCAPQIDWTSLLNDTSKCLFNLTCYQPTFNATALPTLETCMPACISQVLQEIKKANESNQQQQSQTNQTPDNYEQASPSPIQSRRTTRRVVHTAPTTIHRNRYMKVGKKK